MKNCLKVDSYILQDAYANKFLFIHSKNALNVYVIATIVHAIAR